MLSVESLTLSTALLSSEASESGQLRANEVNLFEKMGKNSPSSSLGSESFRYSLPRIGTLGVMLVAFFNVSGGPWGCEGIVAAAGPLPGFIGLFLVAFLWGLPLALITAELSSRFPEDGGYSIWVAEAFGEFWGFQESYWSWVSGVIDNALYPVLAFKALEVLVFSHDIVSVDPENDMLHFDSMTAYLLKFALTLLFSAPLFFTVRDFGSGLGVLAVFVLLPFIAFAFYSFYISDTKNYSLLFSSNPMATWQDWFKAIQELSAILYWNFSGLDCVSTCAGEVRNPKTSFKRGLILALFLIIFAYLVPLASAVTGSTQNEWVAWDEGSFIEIIDSRMGMSMGIWILIASFVGNAGMHAAEMFEDSWQLCGMAEAGLAPILFALRHPKFNTPISSIIFSIVIILFLITLDFMDIVAIDNFFSVTSSILELLAFLKIRAKDSTNQRYSNNSDSYRLPIEGQLKLSLFIFVPFALGSFVMLNSFFDSKTSMVLDVIAILFGVGLFYYMKFRGNIRYISKHVI